MVRMFLAGLICFVGAARAAFTIEPALVSINASMGESMAWVELVHTGGGPMAISMTIYERELDIDGNQKMDALVKSPDFMVYPSEVILYPGERARAQVTYKSKRKVTADRAYFLFSKEVPLPIEEEGGGVRVGVNTLMNYYTVVALETGKPGKITFLSSKAIDDGKIEVVVENTGGGRVRLDGLAIMAGGQTISDFTGRKNSIMPGQKRRFTFKHSKPLTAKEFGFVAAKKK